MIREDLFYLQQNFKCNKDSYNEFGKFKYRNLEQILYELKPLLRQRECTITFETDMVNLSDRYYIKSICTLTNKDNESVSAIGWAREDLNRAGMSESQTTGCAMSYANKYSICLLLAISEELDPDSMDNRPKSTSKPQVNIPCNEDNLEWKPDNITLLTEFCTKKKQEANVDKDKLLKFFNYYKDKMNNWTGKLNLEQLFNKWMTN